MDPEPWMYDFQEFNQQAEQGRYLPTLEDLYCGMLFFLGSLLADVQEWLRQIIPHLAKKGQKIPRNRVQIVLERLKVRANLEDLKFAHGEIIKRRIPHEIFEEISRAERRLVFYRVASGDEFCATVVAG